MYKRIDEKKAEVQVGLRKTYTMIGRDKNAAQEQLDLAIEAQDSGTRKRELRRREPKY